MVLYVRNAMICISSKMAKDILEKKNRRLHLQRSACMFILVLCSGLGISCWKSYAEYSRSIDLRLARAVEGIDTVISHAQQASQKAESLKPRYCDNALQTNLRMLVASIPDIRSISLIGDKKVFCSSVYGLLDSFASGMDNSKNKLMIISINNITPYRSLLIYQNTDKQGNGSLIGIDVCNIINIFKLLSLDKNIYLQVGNNRMYITGEVLPSSVKNDIKSKKSLEFPYSVSLESDYKKFVYYFLRIEYVSVIVIIIMSAFLSRLYYHYLSYKQTMEYRIRNGLSEEEIFPVIQPIVNANNGKIIGGEILMRWITSEGKSIPPDQFIPIAESNGMIKAITTKTFQTISNNFLQNNKIYKENIIVFFNISAANFDDETLLHDCNASAAILSRYNVSIGLEITERTTIDENDFSRHITQELRKSGVAIALDDFGTGNANYMYIRQFEPNFIKIDKTFTRKIDSDKLSKTSVESMLSLGKSIECKVIAEGIETENQRKILYEMGVDFFQGYLYSKPIPLSEFFDKLKSYD